MHALSPKTIRISFSPKELESLKSGCTLLELVSRKLPGSSPQAFIPLTRPLNKIQQMVLADLEKTPTWRSVTIEITAYPNGSYGDHASIGFSSEAPESLLGASIRGVSCIRTLSRLLMENNVPMVGVHPFHLDTKPDSWSDAAKAGYSPIKDNILQLLSLLDADATSRLVIICEGIENVETVRGIITPRMVAPNNIEYYISGSGRVFEEEPPEENSAAHLRMLSLMQQEKQPVIFLFGMMLGICLLNARRSLVAIARQNGFDIEIAQSDLVQFGFGG